MNKRSVGSKQKGKLAVVPVRGQLKVFHVKERELILEPNPFQLLRIRPTTKAEKIELRPFSNSRAVNVNQCPTWGVVSAQKKYKTQARSLALEAGSTMHEVFAAVRIWQLNYVQNLPRHAKAVGTRIFGAKRWKAVTEEATAKNEREHLMELSFAILHSSGWYDDDRDKTRTMHNMEIASINYIDEQLPKMDNWHLYVEDKKKPDCMVGIEQAFDVVLEFTDGVRVRYIGTIDGLVIKRGSGENVLDENKTAARLDAGWRESFQMAHQVTGYCASSTSVFKFPVMKSRVTGLRLKAAGGEDVIPIEVSRDISFVFHWASWLRHTAEMYHRFENDYENAPRYTHSCNRYFRPCSLIAFCADTPEGRSEQWDQMVPADQSPSERAVADG